MEALGFRDTGDIDEANEAPFSAAYLPSGWSIIWSNDFEYASVQNLSHLSDGLTILGCQVEEHVMFSAAHAVMNGRALWTTWHDAQTDIYDINSTGDVPAEFDEIAAAQRAEQDAHGGAGSEVDYCFDAPLGLAMKRTGYRHDHWRFDWGEPRFTVIEPTG